MQGFLKKIAALLFCALTMCAASVSAQNVLLLTTGSNEPAFGLPLLQNLESELNSTGATVTVNSTSLAAGTATPLTAAMVAGYNVVVVATVYSDTDPAAWTVLQSAITSKASGAFIFFSDTCCNFGTTGTRFLNTINAAATGLSLPTIAYGAIKGTVTNNLNTSSAYVSSFSSIPLFYGAAYRTFLNLPNNNILYADPVTATEAYTAILPASATQSCVLATADISAFDDANYPLNQPSGLGAAFMNAATSPTGSCGVSAGPNDLAITITGPTSVSRGNTFTYRVTATNNSAAAVSNVRIISQLLDTGSTGTALTLNSVTPVSGASCSALPCAIASMTAGGTAVFDISITVPVTYLPTSFSDTVTISAPIAEANMTNNRAAITTNVTAVPPAVILAVPALSWQALVALLAALLMAGMYVSRQQMIRR